MNLLQERRRFEAWCLERGIEYHSVKAEDGSVLIYYNLITNAMWEAWQAALK